MSLCYTVNAFRKNLRMYLWFFFGIVCNTNAERINCQNNVEWSIFFSNMTHSAAKSILESSKDGFDICPMGHVTACILASNISECKLSNIPFRHYLVTRWPVIDLLTSIWINRRQNGTLTPHCDDLVHISLNWKEFRSLVLSAMLSGSRDTWNEVLKQVDDIAWKSNSDAITPSGETVKSLTHQCPYGVSLAALLRAWGIALHPISDTMRIIEGLLHYAEHWMFHMEEALLTEWPIVPVMRLLRRARYYEYTFDEISVPKLFSSDVILIQLKLAESIPSVLDHYESLSLLDMLYIVPLSEEVKKACELLFLGRCFPVGHKFVYKYSILLQVLRESSRVLFLTDSSIYIATDPFTISNEFDLSVYEEKYSRTFDLSFLLFRNTSASIRWLETVVEWVKAYPYGTERGAILYLLQYPDPYVWAPEYSYMVVPSEIPVLDIFVLESKKTHAICFKNEKSCLTRKYIDFVNKTFPSATGIGSTGSIGSIVHISFASGCCERDQQLCGSSATQVGGANSSISMGAADLSKEFLASYANILNYDRTNLTAGKTPSSVVGYYAWKPFVILRALENIPWGEILVYTDAGVHFTSDMRPILAKYLRVSDVVGASTVMLEAHVAKRDAFIELEVDDDSAMLTNQIASCFIAVRKTPRAIELFKWWLAAAGCETVIAETDNVLTAEANADGFRFNNDDQVGFSLLMKKFNFTPMQNNEMLSFLSTARNIAKFLAAANNYALGRNATDVAEYMEAADKELSVREK